jgi:hypothetical protein
MLTLAQNWVLFQNGATLADIISGGWRSGLAAGTLAPNSDGLMSRLENARASVPEACFFTINFGKPGQHLS